jgi:hypothetical protein
LDDQSWSDKLVGIFIDAPRPEDYDKDYYEKFSSELSKVMHRDIADSFNSLEPENKKKFIELLKCLANYEKLSDENRRVLYKETAAFFNEYFRWDEEDSVGWIF